MMPEIKGRNRTLEITQCGFSLILRTREVEWLPRNHILSYVYLSFHKHLLNTYHLPSFVVMVGI